MGHSTLDIPVALLMPAAKDEFLEWVFSLPVTMHNKRHLLAVWKRATNAALYADDYLTALGSYEYGLPHGS